MKLKRKEGYNIDASNRTTDKNKNCKTLTGTYIIEN